MAQNTFDRHQGLPVEKISIRCAFCGKHGDREFTLKNPLPRAAYMVKVRNLAGQFEYVEKPLSTQELHILRDRTEALHTALTDAIAKSIH